jgi:4-phytase/acid phosphatase
MARICRLRGKGRGGALTWAVLVSWLCLAGQIRIADAEEPAANVEAPRPSIFTVIVTRHGVRSPTKFLGGEYTWPRWDPVRDAFLTKHGYQLMTLMGAFYGEPVLGAPVDCGKVFVYADKDQRTYLTAQALLAGLCRPGTIGPIYHEPDVTAADPIFNGAKWVGKRINFSDSSNAIKAVAGDPPSKIVTSHAEDFAIFQRLLDTRCPSRNCAPIERGDSAIQPTKEGLAELGGPLNTASSYSEDLFLEYAQCRAIAQIAPGNDEDTLKVYLNAGLRLHVLAYQVNARNAYNPLVRGGTLLGHIVGMLDMKAARPNVLNVVTPAEVKDKALVILSGHDTQLGALGGILGAHWSPGGGVAPDDMAPRVGAHHRSAQDPDRIRGAIALCLNDGRPISKQRSNQQGLDPPDAGHRVLMQFRPMRRPAGAVRRIGAEATGEAARGSRLATFERRSAISNPQRSRRRSEKPQPRLERRRVQALGLHPFSQRQTS